VRATSPLSHPPANAPFTGGVVLSGARRYGAGAAARVADYKDKEPTMYIKIMDAENAPDNDSRKTYRLLADVISVKFSRISGVDQGPEVGAFVFVTFKVGVCERFDVPGNAYLMNENGKTISSWGSAPFGEAEFPAAD
jgi:hypothetical protein